MMIMVREKNWHPSLTNWWWQKWRKIMMERHWLIGFHLVDSVHHLHLWIHCWNHCCSCRCCIVHCYIVHCCIDHFHIDHCCSHCCIARCCNCYNSSYHSGCFPHQRRTSKLNLHFKHLIQFKQYWRPSKLYLDQIDCWRFNSIQT